ncbi:MAG: ATP-binding protein [Eubacteriales bacterium]
MLFKSVFARYMVAFMMIILLSFLILALIITSLVQNYSNNQKQEELQRVAISVKTYLQTEYDDGEYEGFAEYIQDDHESIQRSLTAITRYSGEMFTVITDDQGQVLVCDDSTPMDLISTLFPAEVLDKVSSDGSLMSQSDLMGSLPAKHYAYAYQIMSDNGEIIGYLFTCKSSEAAAYLMETMIKMIVLACMWVMCAAIIASYFISERTVRPLRNLSRAAKSFAAGQLDVRVEVRGNDEIAELGMAFNNMASSLATLEDTRRTFLANVSHDLRTPMTTIAGYIDNILAGTIPPEKQEYYLNIIASEVRRLSRLVTSLLDITRIQAGERKFTMASFDICELARQVLISFEQRIDEKHLDVSFDCEDERMMVVADRDAIHQILYNICDNAVKFSREGGAYRINLREMNRKVYVSVYNEGQGIPAEDLPHIFDRFYKSDKSRSLDKSGVGLGMYIAKTIIDAHGETISVSSKQGEYCEFTFTLKKDTVVSTKK